MSKQFINLYKRDIKREILYMHLIYILGFLILFILYHDTTAFYLVISFFGLVYLYITYAEVCMVVKLIKFIKLNKFYEACNNHLV